MLRILCNGEAKTLPAPCNIAEALQQWGYQTGHFAVVVNARVIPQSSYRSTYLCEADQLEIVSPFAGG